MNNVDYNLIDQVMEYIEDSSDGTDIGDSCVRVAQRKLAEAVGLPLENYKLLHEKEVKPLYRK